MSRKRAGVIDTFERDYFLKLHEEAWPAEDLPVLKNPHQIKAKEGYWEAEDWQLETSDAHLPRYLWRKLFRQSAGKESTLNEVIVRFPSAPLFGSQRKRDYQVRLTPVNYHAFRILRSSTADRTTKRVFLLFNGLNETDNLDFYYDIAGFLLETPQTACIICPFPGHLMRYPMVGRYAEKPLNRFIRDPSDLFRQYLRFMVEMRWLLSILAPTGQYPVIPGMSLLASSDDIDKSRCDAEILSVDIKNSWDEIRRSSASLLSERPPIAEKRGPDVLQKNILETIHLIRHLLDWSPSSTPLSAHKDTPVLPPPLLHVVGYSLGGYLAQSVFFTWPFAISGCTTVCSGGALPGLRLVKFAHEEEWKSVTHGLKYEIESGMLEGRIRFDPPKKEGAEPHSIVGIPATSFSSFFRIFNDVFLQDPNGSYRSRVSEFAPRLLFVVGGNDPIVTTRSVLEASPAEGINMIEIANLSHFVATDRGEWREFWLPTVAHVMNSLAGRAEVLASKSVLENLWNSERTGPADGIEWPKNVVFGKRGHRQEEREALDSERFQEQLTNLVELTENDNGFLLVLRNQLPTALMGPHLLQKRGTVPHYEDRRVRDYWVGLKQRREKMKKNSDHLAIIVPRRLHEWFQGPTSILSAKNEPTAHALPSKSDLEEIWRTFLHEWEPTGALFRFDPEDESLSLNMRPDAEELKLEKEVRKLTRTEDPFPILNCLPDVWIGVSTRALNAMLGKRDGKRMDREEALETICHFVFLAFKEMKEKQQPMIGQAEGWLESKDLSIIRVSGAESNPRFLGERIWSFRDASDLLVHSALALAHCVQCKKPGDFSELK